MTDQELTQIIETAQGIVKNVIDNIDTMNGDGLSRLNVKLSGYYSSICGFHESIKSEYIEMWTALRPSNKSDKSCDMFLLKNNEAAKNYDNLKYVLKGLDKVIKSVDSRLYILNQQAKNQT